MAVQPNPMQWVSLLSTRPSLEAALSDVVQRSQESLQGAADLGIVFISAAFASEYSRLMPLLQAQLPGLPLIGCGGGGVVGCDRHGRPLEIEDKPALCLTLASLPDVKVHPFHFRGEQLPDLDSPPDAWIDLIGVAPADEPQFVLLGDPFSSRLTDLLQGLDYAYPGSIKVGGLASTGAANANSGLFCNDRLYREGMVGVALTGAIAVETIVAQGCRPIGETYRVVEGERNILLALEPAESYSSVGGSYPAPQKRPPLEVLQDVIQDLSEDDRLLAQNALFVGVAQSAFKQDLEQGDFLIRNLIGVDPRVGAIAIGDRVRPGQRIRFHLRDAETSAEDLDVLLKRHQRQNRALPAPIGALMFACMGRGEGLYGEPNFDAELFRQYWPDVPLSGFFCNGEIGPVGDNTFLHGYTSVFGIFRQP
jgi:small ligand-binding sensory domain FIST